jgi:hypothetical protein
MGRYIEKNRGAALDLWATGRYGTWEIAELLMMREADVERVIHADRELRRRVA